MTETSDDKKRVTCKRPHPNPRVHELLESLYKEAVRTRSPHIPDLKQAISSLEKYPLPLSSGAECAILKGFDTKLCKYIDLHLNGKISINKKTRVNEHPNELGPSTSAEVEVTSDSETASTSKRNRKKKKQLITNTKKCSFDSQFGKPSTSKAASAAHTEMHSVNATGSNPKSTSNNRLTNHTATENHNATVDLAANVEKHIEPVSHMEKNNNTNKSDCQDETCTGAVSTVDNNIIKIVATKAGPPPPYRLQNNHFVPPENWESFTNDGCQEYRKKYDIEITRCYNKEPVVDILEDSSTTDSSLSSSSSDDEGNSQPTIIPRQPDRYFQPIRNIQQPVNNLLQSDTMPHQPINNLQHSSNLQQSTRNFQQSASSQEPNSSSQSECLHKDELINCKQCESITTAADAFELYYRDKMKRDAEETERYVLPHKLYKPAYRSGAYAILVALLEQRNECPYRDCLTKDELIQKAQKHTDQSFTSPKPYSNHTAWINAKRLINKGMIELITYEQQTEDFYMLTVMGRAVATELVKKNTPEVTINDVIFHGQRNDRVPSLEEEVVLIPPPSLASVNEDLNSVFIEMPPGTFDIVMLIDKREHFDSKLPASPNNYSKYESRSLNMGDFIWVARSKKTGQELVLPYVVERKTLDDFCASIKDGRYHEQKFRLRKCGLSTVMYLVENNKKNKQPSLPVSTVTQAMNNMCIQDDFFVIKTVSMEHTFRFLGLFSENLVHQYLPKFLRGCNKDTQGRELMTFEFFNKFSCKNKPLTVKDTFVKMLLQLKGLSVEKALAITEMYSTPYALMKAYGRCTEKEGELLLSRLKFNNFTRHVGPIVSKTIYKLFSKLEI